MTVPAADIHPVVRAAVTALDSFGAHDRRTAGDLLDCWARRFQLTDSEVRAVLAHYPGGDGFDFSREPDNGEPTPMPPGVVGTPLGRRAGR